MATVRDTLIAPALRIVGATGSGEVPSAAEANEALSALNTMLDAWVASSLLVYNKIRAVYDTVPGQSVYTFGPTGQWVAPVNAVYAISSLYGSAPYTEIPINMYDIGEWQAQAVKGATGSNAQYTYVDSSSPNANVTLWPVPTINGKIAVYYAGLVTQFTSLDAEVSLPNGYREAIIYALAVRLFVEYGKPVDAAVAEFAQTSLATVKRANIHPRTVMNDVSLLHAGRRYNFNNRTGF